MKCMLSSVCFVFLYYALVTSANDSLSKHYGLNLRTYLSSNSDIIVHTNNSHFLNSTSGFYEHKKWQFNSVLSANQRKCLNDVLYLLKNIKSDWAMKSKFYFLWYHTLVIFCFEWICYFVLYGFVRILKIQWYTYNVKEISSYIAYFWNILEWNLVVYWVGTVYPNRGKGG